MIVTLPKPDDAGYSESVRQTMGRPRRTVSVAYHEPIAHWLGRPCIYFNPRPRWHRYPLVHQKNVVPILIHESIHCVLMRLFSGSQYEMVNHGFDRMFPTVEDVPR